MPNLEPYISFLLDILPTAESFVGWMHGYVFYYPLFMTYLWIIGATYYFIHWDQWSRVDAPPELPVWPFLSIIVPCHNEGPNLGEVIEWLADQDYPDFEIIAVNDGSTDNTGELLDGMLERYPR